MYAENIDVKKEVCQDTSLKEQKKRYMFKEWKGREARKKNKKGRKAIKNKISPIKTDVFLRWR